MTSLQPGFRRIAVLIATVSLLAGPGAAAARSAEEAPADDASRPGQPLSAGERRAIEEALPGEAPAVPGRPGRLLIFDLNVGYPGHRSIRHANYAFKRMGERTGAFRTEIHRDPEVFRPEGLERFGAVFLNNTVGNLFEDPELRRSLVEFVFAGGGLLGVHGTTVAFTRWPGAHEDWPEFGLMLGGRGARHRASDERVFIKIDSPGHPLVVPFPPGGFEYRDEFFRVGDPYSRKRVRVLLTIDTRRTDLGQGEGRFAPERADGDYALSWVRNYGRGRVFYSTVAHNPGVFSDSRMLEFYLRAVQFALGDLPAPTLPSACLTPAARAREKLGWRLGVTAYSFHKFTFFEAIEKTAELGVPYIGGLSFQRVSRGISKNLEPGLSPAELERIRLRLDSAGVRLMTYYIHRIPADEAGCRRIFDFGRQLGIETFISEPLPEALDTIERFCGEYQINVAIHNHGPDQSPHCWHPEKILELCEDRSERLGACGDVGYWLRAGIDPVEAVRTLGKRLITLQMHDLHEEGPEGHDVPWGTGVGGAAELIREIHRLGLRPTLFGLEYSRDWLGNMPAIAECRDFFDRLSLELAP